MNYKDENKMKHLTLGAIGFIAFCFVANSVKADTTIQDHTKTIIKRTPFNVEVCSEVDVQGDKTKDTFSLLHTNICSLQFNGDNLQNLLA